MVNLSKVLADMKTDMILQVHDELLFEAPEDEADEAMEIIVSRMRGDDDPDGEFSLKKISVPLEVEIGKGNNWSEAH